jgi:hypothetical protein
MTEGLMIEYQCPQCGAPAVLEETDRLFSCEFCRVKSYLIPGDYFRYLLPSKTGLEEDLIYFPYWRYKAMVFSCLPGGIEGGFLDLSSQATPSRRFPISVGIRSQTLRLKFATKENDGRFISPSISIKDMTENLFRHQSKVNPSQVFQRTHIGHSLGLIYAPFQLKDRLMDAITHTPVSIGDPAEPIPESTPFSDLNWQIRFVPTLCPDCGWDLEGEKDALVLTCGNCRSAYTAMGDELKKLEVCYRPSDNPNVVYLPFWRFAATVSGLALETYGDLIRCANLPKVVKASEADRPFHFWTPAFKVAPKAFLRLSTSLTLSQPELSIRKETPAGRAICVNLSVKAAAESLKIGLAGLVRPREEFFPILDTIDVTARRVLLVYMPFMDAHHEWTHQDPLISVHKNLFRSSGDMGES